MTKCTEAMCQKCHHPTSCEGQICSGIMGNNIQSCAYLPPCHLMEGSAVGISEKMIAKKKLTEKLFQPAEHSLFSHLHKELQVTLLSTSGQLEGCPNREYLGCVFCLHHHMAELYQGHRLHEEAFNPEEILVTYRGEQVIIIQVREPWCLIPPMPWVCTPRIQKIRINIFFTICSSTYSMCFLIKSSVIETCSRIFFLHFKIIKKYNKRVSPLEVTVYLPAAFVFFHFCLHC